MIPAFLAVLLVGPDRLTWPRVIVGALLIGFTSGFAEAASTDLLRWWRQTRQRRGVRVVEKDTDVRLSVDPSALREDGP